LSCIHSELAGKRLEMLKELVPSLTRIAVLFNPSDPNKRLEFEQVKDAARRLGIAVRDFEVANAEGIDPAFAAISAERTQALMVLVDAFTIFHRKKLADLALAVLTCGFRLQGICGGGWLAVVRSQPIRALQRCRSLC
jgi:putative ABC transport system substrate-binding protein